MIPLERAADRDTSGESLPLWLSYFEDIAPHFVANRDGPLAGMKTANKIPGTEKAFLLEVDHWPTARTLIEVSG